MTSNRVFDQNGQREQWDSKTFLISRTKQNYQRKKTSSQINSLTPVYKIRDQAYSHLPTMHLKYKDSSLYW